MLSPRLRKIFKSEQQRTLSESSKAKKVLQRIKDRASAIRLSAMSYKVEKMAIYLKKTSLTVRATICQRNKLGLMRLWGTP